MCGGGDTPEIDTSFQDWTKEQAWKARQEEQRRKVRVTDGMRAIEAIFEGGTHRPLTKARGRFDPRARYFTPEGKRWRPQPRNEGTQSIPYKETSQGRYYRMPDGNVAFESIVDEGQWYNLGEDGEWDDGGWSEMEPPGLGDLGRGTGRREQYRDAKGGLLMRGRGKQYAGMEPLLAEREKAMRGYYLPQLRENFGDARDDLTFALARAGLGVSTAANEKRSDLRQGFRRERAGVLSDIERDLSATRSSINDSRSAIEAQLRSSGDATAATDAALRSRATFAEDAPELNPLTNTLLAFAQNIGQVRNGLQVGNIRRTAAGGGFEDQSRIVS